MSSFQRRLPHWRPDGRPLFLTWRLHDSLPRHRFFPASSLSAGKAFVAMDRLLDQARTGPLYLARPEIASLVVEAILEGRDPLGHYDLHAFVVMANHVHLLITPAVPVPGLLQRLKGTTARRANQMLSLTGRAFWQEESFDRWVRDEREFQRIRAYIEENPVRAGLVTAPEDYPWSSAWRTGCGEPG
jgi:REP element-mobilizing transposase RayT